MRSIDADALLNEIAYIEAEALEQVVKYYDTPEGFEDWRLWSAILSERTAFKHDLMDAPTVEVEPTEEQVKEYCRKRQLVLVSSEMLNDMKEYYGGVRNEND